MQEENKQIILMGYSGHAIVVAEAALLLGMEIIGYTAKSPAKVNPYKIAYLGDENNPKFKKWSSEFTYLIGIGDNNTRTRVAEYIRESGFDCLTLIHPESSVSKFTEVKSGVFIARGAVINPLCDIGRDVIINTSASLDHECRIGDGSHIAPGAVLAGNVTVGKKSLIGANSVIKQGVLIGDNVVVGAGTVVINDLKSGSVVVGNPSKRINV